jgi:DNA-binding MarR family transcriptional regulator
MGLAETPTYYAGIMQSKAYRVLKQLMAKLLKKHDLTMMDWAMLGLVYEAGRKGIRITDLAAQLDTTKAFVTNHINLLEAKRLVSRAVDVTDTRARIVKLEPKARPKVAQIEKELRADMREHLYGTIAPSELEAYVRVLNQIASIETR